MIPIPYVAILLIVAISFEARALWRGMRQGDNKVYVAGQIMPAFIIGGFLCYQTSLLVENLKELNASPGVGMTTTMLGSASSPWSLGSFGMFLAQFAAVLPLTVVAGAATYLYRSSHSASDSDWRWYVLYIVFFWMLPLLSWHIVYSIVELIRSQHIRMTSFYVSLIVWVIIGLASVVYYVKNRFVSAGGQAG